MGFWYLWTISLNILIFQQKLLKNYVRQNMQIDVHVQALHEFKFIKE
jgi:uncharacterized membrane protein SpoIIM required for sporulation